MSPIRPSKRRRLDNASHTLSQPFKSPFKTPLKPKTDTEAHLPTPRSSPVKDKPPTAEELQHSTSLPLKTPSTSITTPFRRPPSFSSQITPSSTSSEYTALQTQHTRLLTQLSTARAALETSSQALKIESSTRDAELDILIQKWKAASRAAAEEVFAKARDRVNKMGGVGAMREREKQSKSGWGWDEEPGKGEGSGEHGDQQGGHEDEEDGAGFKSGEYEGEEKKDAEKEGVGDDDEGYTMDMMLKALNIELDLIGFDKVTQKWVD